MVRDEVSEYARPLEGEFGRQIRKGVTVALNQFVDLLGTDCEPPDTDVYFELGRVEHRAGRTLDALQSAYRVGSRVAWRRIASGGDTSGLEPAAIYRLAEAMFAYTERLAAASVAGYAHEQSIRAGSRQARRHALIELLARRPTADPREVERVAAEAGWSLPPRLAALVVGDDAVLVARRMPVGAIGAMLDPVGVVLVPDPDGPGRFDGIAGGLRGRRAVLGPSVPWAQADRSIARARAAWSLHAAGQLPAEGLVRADDHLLALLLAADPELAADLVERRLAPLRVMSPMARERAVETLRAWLASHGDVTSTAHALRVHPQTVRHRLSGLRQVFGESLADPATRLEIELALRAAAAVDPD